MTAVCVFLLFLIITLFSSIIISKDHFSADDSELILR